MFSFKAEKRRSHKVIFTLFCHPLLLPDFIMCCFFRLRQSYFRELADSKLLEGQRSGGKAITLFTKGAALKK